jgi:chromosome partitioning protein
LPSMVAAVWAMAEAEQHSVLVLNSKGGAGKTTVATNLASLLALRASVLLADLDPQGSSSHWWRRRPPQLPAISLVSDPQRKFRDYPPAQWFILDAPAGLKRSRLEEMLDEVSTLLVPITASAFDMDASLVFLERLQEIKRFRKGRVRIGIVANRVHQGTRAKQALEAFLRDLDLPVIAFLRDSQIYVHAAAAGVGIADLRASETRSELPQWTRVLQFLGEVDRGT